MSKPVMTSLEGYPLPFASGGMSAPVDAADSDYMRAFNEWKKTPTPTTAGGLLKAVDPFVNRGIKLHLGSNNDTPTIRGKAKAMALRAAETFDPSRGASLATHITNNLQSLRRYSRRRNNVVYVPEKVNLQLAHLQRARAELEEQLQREPTEVELMDFTGLTEKRLRQLETAQRPVVSEGFLDSMQDGEGGQGGLLPAIQRQNDLAMKLVYYDSSPANQKIMEYTLGMFGKRPLTNKQIAKRLGISESAVSQQRQTIQRRIDTALQLKRFQDG